METFIKSFCKSRDYGLGSKKLKATEFSNVTLEKFVLYVKENRGKRKSTLSFEVMFRTVIFRSLKFR